MNTHRALQFGSQMVLAVLAGSFLPGLEGCGASSPGNGIDAFTDTQPLDAPACPANCDDKNDCTTDSCDPDTGLCVHSAVPDGTACEDGSACTVNDICRGGLCFSGPFKKCTALDQCHVAGVCSPKTGECSNPNANSAISCDDGLKCTFGDHCQDGVCAGAPLVCAGNATCDPTTGGCPGNAFPVATSGFVFENLYWPTNGNALATTPDGSIFAGGSFVGTSDLGAGLMDTGDSNLANHDLFLARLDPTTGKATWSTSFPGPESQDAIAFAASGKGQLGLLGPLYGILTVGSAEPVIAAAAGDNFVLGASPLDGTGWVRRINLRANPSSTLDVLNSLAGDPNENTFVLCGTSSKAATDLSPDLTLRGGLDVVLAKLDGATGATRWALQIGGINDEICNSVAVDPQSNIYVAGTYQYGSTVLIPGVSVPPPIVDQTNNTKWLFIAKLHETTTGDAGAPTAAGDWVQGFGNPGTQHSFKATAIFAVSDGVVVAGRASPGSSIAGTPLDSTFVAKLRSSTGEVAWVIPLGTNGSTSTSNTVTAISTNSAGALIVSGNYAGAFTLGNVPLPQVYQEGAFLAQLDGTTGRVLTARGYGDTDSSNLVVGVATNVSAMGEGKDTSLVLGQFTGQIDLGAPAGVLTSASQGSPRSTFGAKLAP